MVGSAALRQLTRGGILIPHIVHASHAQQFNILWANPTPANPRLIPHVVRASHAQQFDILWCLAPTHPVTEI